MAIFSAGFNVGASLGLNIGASASARLDMFNGIVGSANSVGQFYMGNGYGSGYGNPGYGGYGGPSGSGGNYGGGGSNNIVDYCHSVFSDNRVMDYFYTQLYRDFSPDINGFTLTFMIAPCLSGYGNILNAGGGMNMDITKLTCFAAIDFTPPQSQINAEQINTRTGAIPFATEVTESDSCSVTYIDNNRLDIFKFHHIWLEYIRDVLNGSVKPDDAYLVGDQKGIIDYAASIYVVRYMPDMRQIVYAGKAVGVFPQSLPSKEVIGTRTSNEIVTIPFSYYAAAYREALPTGRNSWIFNELNNLVTGRF